MKNTTQYIVAVGDLLTGFHLFGPFPNEDAAHTFIHDEIDAEATTRVLYPPKEAFDVLYT